MFLPLFFLACPEKNAVKTKNFLLGLIAAACTLNTRTHGRAGGPPVGGRDDQPERKARDEARHLLPQSPGT